METDGRVGGTADRAHRAYMAGGRWARERMARDTPDEAAWLARVEEGDIVVVEGCYDHVERVLAALGLPYVAVDGRALARLRLRPEQLLVVNCPGELPGRTLPLVEAFVRGGGSLFTTDWALRHVLEAAFPGMVAFNERATGDDVVRVHVRTHANPLLAGVMDPGDDPVWWLEESSFPIRVLDERVEVLVASAEMAERYGEPAICVRFDWGAGEVLHMASHYYLQRTELRSDRHDLSAGAWAETKGVSAPRREEADLLLGEVQTAQTSARFLAQVVARKKGTGRIGADGAGRRADPARDAGQGRNSIESPNSCHR